METTRIEYEKEFDAENPIFIEGLAGIGHVGRNVVSYIADHTDAEHVGSVHSHHFPPFAMVEDDKTVETIKNTIYQVSRDDNRDLVILEGNAQASTPQGHHEVAEKIMDIVDDCDASELITVGGYGQGDVIEDPSVFSVTTSEKQKEEVESAGATFDHDVGQIVGVSGLLLARGKENGYEGTCFLGETPGFLLSDPKSTEEVLKVLEQYLDLDLDHSDLDEKVEESQQVLEKIQNLKQSDSGREDGVPDSDLGYIG